MGLDNPTEVTFNPKIDLVNLNLEDNDSIKEYIIYLLFHSGFITGERSGNKLQAVIPNL